MYTHICIHIYLINLKFKQIHLIQSILRGLIVFFDLYLYFSSNKVNTLTQVLNPVVYVLRFQNSVTPTTIINKPTKRVQDLFAIFPSCSAIQEWGI